MEQLTAEDMRFEALTAQYVRGIMERGGLTVLDMADCLKLTLQETTAKLDGLDAWRMSDLVGLATASGKSRLDVLRDLETVWRSAND